MDLEAMTKELGIDILTGEADATGSQRLLCDMDSELIEDIKDFLGATKLGFPEGWNNRNKVAIILSRRIMPVIVTYLARKRGYWVIQKTLEDKTDLSCLVFTTSMDTVLSYKRNNTGNWWVREPIGAVTRNTHQMTGRKER